MKLLPHDHAAEAGLICAFIGNPSKTGGMCAEHGITESFFHIPAHNVIFATLLEMWQASQRIDTITLCHALSKRNQLEEAGGRFGVTELSTFIPTYAMAEQHLAIVVEKYRLREVISSTALISSEAGDAGAESDLLLGSLGEAITRIGGASLKSKSKAMVDHFHDKVNRAFSDTPDHDVLKTGIELLDRHSPVRLGDMPLITGEKKAGKSIFSLTVALNLAIAGHSILYFSLEDSVGKVIDRAVANEARVPIVSHHQRLMSEGEMQRFSGAIDRLIKRKMTVRDDVHELNAMVAVIRQTKNADPKLAAVFLDYAQLLRCFLKGRPTREQEVATVSRTLRLLGIELGIAIFVLCQLNKEGVTRESATLEMDCTAMWKITKTDDDEHGKRLIVIPFQRNGDSNIAFPVAFLGHIAKIENLADAQPS